MHNGITITTPYEDDKQHGEQIKEKTLIDGRRITIKYTYHQGTLHGPSTRTWYDAEGNQTNPTITYYEHGTKSPTHKHQMTNRSARLIMPFRMNANCPPKMWGNKQ